MKGGKHAKKKEPGKFQKFLGRIDANIQKRELPIDDTVPSTETLQTEATDNPISPAKTSMLEEKQDNPSVKAPTSNEATLPTETTASEIDSVKETEGMPQPSETEIKAKRFDLPFLKNKIGRRFKVAEPTDGKSTEKDEQSSDIKSVPSPRSTAAEKPLFSSKNHLDKKVETVDKPNLTAESKEAKKKEKKRIKQVAAEKKKQERAAKPSRMKDIDPALLAKATYRISISLLVVIIGLSLWLGRDSYTLGGLHSWFQIQFTGSGLGDGFPIKMKGHAAAKGNFTHVGSNAAVLTNTALTVYNPSGKEQYTVRHSFENPDMKSVGNQFILYDTGGYKYIVQDGAKTRTETQLKEEIFSGAISSSGVYGLAVAKSGYASGVDIYTNDGRLKFYYYFADQYVTSLSISADGTQGVVCGITSKSGVMQSVISVFDFNQTEPIYVHEMANNMLVDVNWGENNMIYAVGDHGFLWSSGGKTFQSYEYDDQWITSYRLEGTRAMLSISAYEHSGESTLLCFNGTSEPLEIPLTDHGKSISSFGNMVATLNGDTISFYDSSTGRLMGESIGNYDSKSITLSNERSAFTLGISEIKYTIAESVKE